MSDHGHVRNVYQLVATGDCLCGWRAEHRNRVVFATRQAAERRIDKFRAAVTDPGMLQALVPETVEIKILELEVIDES